VEAKVSSVPLDGLSLKPFLEQDPLSADLDKQIAVLRGIDVASHVTSLAVDSAASLANHAGLKTVEQLRESLAKYHNAILEFVAQYRAHIIAVPPGSSLARGACVYYLGMMLVGSMGTEALTRALSSLPFDVFAREKICLIAAKVMAKY
jgi:hypothetical protein